MNNEEMDIIELESEDGEEMEEFVPVDEDLTDQLIQVVEATFDNDEE